MLPDDPDLRLTKEQSQKILEWMKTKWGDAKCPMCGEDKWSVGNVLAAVNVVSNDAQDTVLGGYYPCVTVVCENCGNLVLLSAIAAGLLPEKEKEGNDV